MRSPTSGSMPSRMKLPLVTCCSAGQRVGRDRRHDEGGGLGQHLAGRQSAIETLAVDIAGTGGLGREAIGQLGDGGAVARFDRDDGASSGEVIDVLDEL